MDSPDGRKMASLVLVSQVKDYYGTVNGYFKNIQEKLEGMKRKYDMKLKELNSGILRRDFYLNY